MKFKFRRAVFILTVIVALAGIHLYIYTQNIGLKYRITDLKIKLGELRSKNRKLGSQVAKKESLDYIEKTAKEKLNMIYPEEVNYILYGSEHPSRETTP